MLSNFPFSLGGQARTGRGSLSPFLAKFSGCSTTAVATAHLKSIILSR